MFEQFMILNDVIVSLLVSSVTIDVTVIKADEISVKHFNSLQYCFKNRIVSSDINGQACIVNDLIVKHAFFNTSQIIESVIVLDK